MDEEKSVIDELVENINNLLNEIDENQEGEEKINSLLVLWDEHNRGIKKFEQTIDRIKTMIKVFLKEKNWTRYDNEESKMSVVITKQRRESFDKEQLKMVLSEGQYAMVLKTTTFEKMQIITPDTRKKMKKMIK